MIAITHGAVMISVHQPKMKANPVVGPAEPAACADIFHLKLIKRSNPLSNIDTIPMLKNTHEGIAMLEKMIVPVVDMTSNAVIKKVAVWLKEQK